MDIQRIAKNLHPLERKLLPHISDALSVEELSKNASLQPVEVMRAVQWLAGKGMLEIREERVKLVSLGANGQRYKKVGMPERRALDVLVKGEMSSGQLAGQAGLDSQELNITLGQLKRQGAIEMRKDPQLIVTITEKGKRLQKESFPVERFFAKMFPLPLSKLPKDEQALVKDLERRKEIVAIDVETTRTVKLTAKGRELQKADLSADVIDALTPQLIRSGEWKEKDFREYDVTAKVPGIVGGRTHFVTQAVEYIRRIWIELGFEEMEGDLVQTAFWDLDALFVPQDHPARQMQDTFYLADPKSGTLPSIKNKVKEVHQDGGDTGSRGWRTDWSEAEAKQNMLRTHTTVLSAQTIAALKEGDLPKKYFAVGKVFRNEALDYKHLFEFFQVEGIVVDPDANFAHLKGYLREFFTKMGYDDVRIRPGHFPYTEPSAEVEVHHPEKGWIELGGSGIFRPEVVTPLLGKPVPVLAWGLGLGRIIMEHWGITDLRDFYRNDLKQLREMGVWTR